MRPQTYSKEHLKEISKHLHYEFWMVTDLAKELETSRPGNSTHNARLESFLVHVRILTDFFYGKRGKDTDLIAEDYFDDPMVWKKSRLKKREVLDVHSRIGKEIVHLSHRRAELSNPLDRIWKFLPIAQEIQKLMEIFIQKVSQELLSEEWQNHQRMRDML